MKYSKAICEMLDKIAERIRKENEVIQTDEKSSHLSKYIAENIMYCMTDYTQNDYLKDNMTETELITLYEYDEKQSILQNIIDDIIDNENDYPLVLDNYFPYFMVIDFAKQLNSFEENCMNCGATYNVLKQKYYKDELGKYTTCKHCGATFDIDDTDDE